jgi:hypothetical protein
MTDMDPRAVAAGLGKYLRRALAEADQEFVPNGRKVASMKTLSRMGLVRWCFVGWETTPLGRDVAAAAEEAPMCPRKPIPKPPALSR